MHVSYACQIEALSDRQKKDYHKMIEWIYEKDEIPVDLVETPDAMLIGRSAWHVTFLYPSPIPEVPFPDFHTHCLYLSVLLCKM